MISTQIEPFAKAIPELKVIFTRHHRELGLFQDAMLLDPQYREYVRRENEGTLFLTTVRIDGTIVAYYVAQVAPGFHYASTLTATMDILYVIPEERNRGLAFSLFRCVERELKRRGVKVWYSGYKNHNPLGLPQFLKAFGFNEADQYCAKWIG